MGKLKTLQTYTKQVLAANNSAVKIIGRVMLLVQSHTRLKEVEHEFITADKGIEYLLWIEFLKTIKCVLNLHEEKLHSSRFKISIPLSTEKRQGVPVFAIARQNTCRKSDQIENCTNIHKTSVHSQ